MPPKNPTPSRKIADLPVWLQVLLFVLSLGLLYLFKQRQQELDGRARIRELIPAIVLALKVLAKKQDMVFYFANSDGEKWRALYLGLFRAVAKNYLSCGLDKGEISIIDDFVSCFRDLDKVRADYNARFIRHELVEFGDFFAGLDSYPLSDEQMRAVVCDEDNNLVIAGAGTGKTTTISAKVAYILEKNLARAEELLVISFTNAAVEEMYDRTCNFLRDDVLARQITFKTFNSFGNMVCRYCSPHPRRIAFDGQDYRVKAFLQQSFDSLFRSSDDFQQKAINFLAFFARPSRDEFSFKSNSDFIKHEQSYRNLTLNGLSCKSQEEVMVANFLYLHQVEFEYERFYPLEAIDRNPEFGDYQSDFYLPGYDIYHEHYGVDENGNVPERFGFSPPFRSANEQYHSGMAWKDSIHEKYGTKLVKTYSFQNRNGTLLRALKVQLEAHGVIMNKRPAGEILGKLKKLDDYEDFMGLVYTFLSLMKSNNASIAALRRGVSDKRFRVFLDVFSPLYDAYQAELVRTGSIDYNDMVNLASGHISRGEFTRRYKYILVDEFQDMSLGRYGLLKALKLASPDAKLYAVGDDWQSIFRFTGSDISIITEFSKHFGVTAQNSVLQTYRFNDKILSLSSGFIQANPSQLRKRLSSPFKAKFSAFELVPQVFSGSKAQRELQKFDLLVEVMGRIAINYSGGIVFLIGRYHHNAPGDLRELQKLYLKFKISYHTAHACKGLNCDVAILLDLDGGVYGFPSQMADDPILGNLLYEGERFENAEERRLFYVALTRARHQVFLLFNPNNRSKFIEELIGDFAIGNS
ncbi:UvrD-helicase domain-containing protein [Pedobacter aquatilis]|uniref:UvrD-helicase domain-containing protein n=1 Tax=Pedobacter aquatilis TaxID=351343 RepID=UPI00292F889E|nr:UvrD-helicase domain-containing protein [Pedobacter aquatilis]